MDRILCENCMSTQPSGKRRRARCFFVKEKDGDKVLSPACTTCRRRNRRLDTDHLARKSGEPLETIKLREGFGLWIAQSVMES